MSTYRMLLSCLMVLGGLVLALPGAVSRAAEDRHPASVEGEFRRLCDLTSAELRVPDRRMQFFRESYAVRALNVAYDMTGNKTYLDACEAWADRMLDFQNRMTPQGAYYMNYHRKPGETTNQWWVADSSSIAMGVLATAVRCKDASKRDRYLASTRSFARLVMENYVSPAGGIRNGLWKEYDGPWWCSTGIFTSLAFLLYGQTHDEAYLKVARGGIDWFNSQTLDNVGPLTLQKMPGTVIFYIMEAYSASLPYLEPGTERCRKAHAQIDWAIGQMAASRAALFSKEPALYQYQPGKVAGFAFHQYIWSRSLPGHASLAADADANLEESARVLAKTNSKLEWTRSQLIEFGMMSYAEKLRPGAMYRNSFGKK